MIKSKKGNIGRVIFIGAVLFILLLIGIFLVFGAIVIDWVADVTVPELSNLGVVGSSNLTEISQYTVTPINSIIQSFTWMGGIFYVLGLVACLGLAFAFRFTGNKWLITLFICIMFLLVIAAIFISNIYEEFYSGTDDVATRLQEHSLLSWMILYSPVIMSILGFICGIIMFTGEGGEEAI